MIPWRTQSKTVLRSLKDALALDADWYLATYPDVRAAGMNPRLHYLRFGRAEGRLPYFGAKLPYLSESPRHTLADRLGERLWAGFAHSAAPELEHRALAGDGRAAWHLALWAYGNGDREGAAAWLARATAPAGPGQKALAQAKCNLPASMDSLAPTDRALVEVNHAQKLASLNALYRAEGLVELGLRDANQPLSLDNLCASVAPAEVEARALITVIMCAHNAVDTLPTALDSVLAQSWSRLEVLVVDDASTDGTSACVTAYQARDSRVRLIRNEYNLGAYGARNRAARAARGEFITVHDCDDWSHPQKLACQVAPLMADQSLVASASRWVRVQEPFQVTGSWQLNEGFLELNPSSWLVRRSAFDRVGHWDSVRVEADTEFAQRLGNHYGHEALATVRPSLPLAFARFSGATLTQQTATHLRTQFYGLRRIYGEASRWWHRANGGAPVMPEQGRPFPVPLGGIMGAKPEVTLVVVANFALDGQPELAEVLAQLDVVRRVHQASERGRLCLLHWPDVNAWAGNAIADAVFAWAQEAGVAFAHPGLSLNAPSVRLLQPLNLDGRPSSTVVLPSVRAVEGPDGQLCEPQDSWLEYFRRGGLCC